MIKDFQPPCIKYAYGSKNSLLVFSSNIDTNNIVHKTNKNKKQTNTAQHGSHQNKTVGKASSWRKTNRANVLLEGNNLRKMMLVTTILSSNRKRAY
jgi:hypothetical protein